VLAFSAIGATLLASCYKISTMTYSEPYQQLSRRERQIMDIVFAEQQVSAQQVLDKLPDPPSYSAVRAMLSRLVKKNCLTHHQDGAKYVYQAVMDTSEAQQSALKNLTKTFFNDSPAAAVSALLGLEKEGLSAKELDDILNLVQAAKKRGQ
jgi:BlaI family penicillinase repressor